MGALPEGEVPLRGELGVGVDGDAARHAELTREVAGGRQACSGAQVPLLNGSAQLSLDLLCERPRFAAVDREQHLVRTARLRNNANWSRLPGHFWIFPWRQFRAKIQPMTAPTPPSSSAPTVNAPAEITITPFLVADLQAEDARMPVYVHVIDHPDARVLVDTGMTALHPLVDDLDPRVFPWSEQGVDLAGIDIVVNTHLHFDHCGGNHLFAGKPVYVQRQELEDARGEEDYTIREWVDAPGVEYVAVDGEHELLAGLRLIPAPGHTRGMQVVLVETGGRPMVVGGDVAVAFGELDDPRTDDQRRVRALDPELVWLTHERKPWRPASAATAVR